MASEAKIGSYVGTGAAINVSLGFKPHYLRIMNETDGDESWDWFSGMAAASALQHAAAGANTKITANGISEYDGSSNAGEGFTVGTALSEVGKTFRYVALRNAEY